jgi:hypothetical protein
MFREKKYLLGLSLGFFLTFFLVQVSTVLGNEAQTSDTLDVTVFEAGSDFPLADVLILVGDEIHSTDETGHCQFSPLPTPPFDITAILQGFANVTLIGANSPMIKIGMKRIQTEQTPENSWTVHGQVKNTEANRRNPFLGLVIPGITSEQMISANPTAIAIYGNIYNNFQRLNFRRAPDDNFLFWASNVAGPKFTLTESFPFDRILALGTTLPLKEMKELYFTDMPADNPYALLQTIFSPPVAVHFGLYSLHGSGNPVSMSLTEYLNKKMSVQISNYPQGLDITPTMVIEEDSQHMYPMLLGAEFMPASNGIKYSVPVADFCNKGSAGRKCHLIVEASDLSGGSAKHSRVLIKNIKPDDQVVAGDFLAPISNMKVVGKSYSFDDIWAENESFPSEHSLELSQISEIMLVPNPENPTQMILKFQLLWEIFAAAGNNTFSLPPISSFILTSGSPYLWDLAVHYGANFSWEDYQTGNGPNNFYSITHISGNSIAYFQE